MTIFLTHLPFPGNLKHTEKAVTEKELSIETYFLVLKFDDQISIPNTVNSKDTIILYEEDQNKTTRTKKPVFREMPKGA